MLALAHRHWLVDNVCDGKRTEKLLNNHWHLFAGRMLCQPWLLCPQILLAVSELTSLKNISYPRKLSLEREIQLCVGELNQPKVSLCFKLIAPCQWAVESIKLFMGDERLFNDFLNNWGFPNLFYFWLEKIQLGKLHDLRFLLSVNWFLTKEILFSRWKVRLNPTLKLNSRTVCKCI